MHCRPCETATRPELTKHRSHLGRACLCSHPRSPQTGHTVSEAKLIPRSQGRGPRAHELRSLLWQSSGPAPATMGTGLNLT